MSDTDSNVCIHCSAVGCDSDTAVHGEYCPFVTGLWPVTQAEIDGEVGCRECGTALVLADHYFTFDSYSSREWNGQTLQVNRLLCFDCSIEVVTNLWAC